MILERCALGFNRRAKTGSPSATTRPSNAPVLSSAMGTVAGYHRCPARAPTSPVPHVRQRIGAADNRFVQRSRSLGDLLTIEVLI